MSTLFRGRRDHDDSGPPAKRTRLNGTETYDQPNRASIEDDLINHDRNESPNFMAALPMRVDRGSGAISSLTTSRSSQTTRHEPKKRSPGLVVGSVESLHQSTPQNEISNRSSTAHEVAESGKEKRDKRILRSADTSSHMRSGLAQFFPEYDEVIFGKERSNLSIDARTTFVIVEARASTSALNRGPEWTSEKDSQRTRINVVQQLSSKMKTRPPVTLRKIDFATKAEAIPQSTRPRDPLPDSVYLQTHRRAERKEKQFRNIEKERTMYEKGELERLLDELTGHEWLRAMGIMYSTDTDKKMYESKRQYFVTAVRALLKKFTLWREQERSLKLKEDSQQSQQQISARKRKRGKQESAHSVQPKGERNHRPSVKKPLSDHHQRVKLQRPVLQSHPDTQKSEAEGTHTVIPKGPFTSFFSKSYERSAALGKHRRARTITAFGLPIPEFSRHEFSLERILDDGLLSAHARQRRRLKRDVETDA